MHFNATVDKFSPTVVQVIVGRKIGRQKKSHVAGERLRDIVLDGGEVNLLDVFQSRRQPPAHLLIDLISTAIQLVFGLFRSVCELPDHILEFFRHTKLAQVPRMRTEFSPVTNSPQASRAGPWQQLEVTGRKSIEECQ